MEFHCRDFRHHGVYLIPPSSPDYAPLLADIQLRLANPVAGSPPLHESLRPQVSEQTGESSAILLNRSLHAIAAIHQIWSFEGTDGRTSISSIGGGANPSVLLPFGIPEQHLKLYGYWHVILPGSKRYLNSIGDQVGDNSDVRPPRPEEMWTGGIICGRGGGNRARGPLKSVTLSLDGVFFADGGFLGPNQMGLWEQIVFAAEAHLQAAKRARETYEQGATPKQSFTAIETVTGPTQDFPLPPPPRRAATPEMYRKHALHRLAQHIGAAREHQGDERALDMVLAWNDTRLPNYRKL